MCINVLKKAVALFLLATISAGATQLETSGPWIVSARIVRNGEPDGSAVYLTSGLVITAAHLTAAEANMGVLIAGVSLPAAVVKQGKFEVVDHAGAVRSHIISPQILPLALQSKFHTLIAVVGPSSGSGVFDPNRKCLLGIMSRVFIKDGKDIAKYFVPSTEIRDFIPVEFKEQVPMK
jgi:hypothetical protein